MSPPHRILNRNRVDRIAAEHLQAHLKFKGYKKKTSAQVLWAFLYGSRKVYALFLTYSAWQIPLSFSRSKHTVHRLWAASLSNSS